MLLLLLVSVVVRGLAGGGAGDGRVAGLVAQRREELPGLVALVPVALLVAVLPALSHLGPLGLVRRQLGQVGEGEAREVAQEGEGLLGRGGGHGWMGGETTRALRVNVDYTLLFGGRDEVGRHKKMVIHTQTGAKLP